jgi:hypothetical protein
MNRFFYNASIPCFLRTNAEKVWADLSLNSRLDDNVLQKDSWAHEIATLQSSLDGLDGEIFFEYSIPRLGKRADVILLIKDVVIVLEYKVGEKSYERPDLEQVWDYALDLKYFHQKSHELWVVPILVATAASERSHVFQPSKYDDKVLEPVCSNDSTLRAIIDQVLELLAKSETPEGWGMSPYNPTPTIVQAATTLYRRKNLENKSIADITNHTSEDRTEKATEAVLRIVEESKRKGQKSICFITGVPGAGKTLVGLDIAINLFEENENKKADENRSLAVYLSGNGPLVKVLREALARDAVEQEKKKNPKTKYNKTRAHKAVDSFIMDVYHHRDYVLQMVKKPILPDANTLSVDSSVAVNDGSEWLTEHVDIFDEAQRSWTYEQLRNWLSRKKGIQNFPMSEPEFLTWGLDKKKDWAVIVCLVGGGQEINTGEAGISTWLSAIHDAFDNWHVYYPANLREKEYADGKVEERLAAIPEAQKHPIEELHLSVSKRSFRAENLSLFVKALLDVDVNLAKEQLQKLDAHYPIRLTRDLEKAKDWLRKVHRGSERYGLLVSSQAYRLRPLSIDVRCKPDTVHWFLDDITDIRSSLFLEDAATEFDVQGLELDYAAIVWDGDMIYDPDHVVLSPKDRKKPELIQGPWTQRSFNGGVWQNIASDMRRMYQLNAYRVLLTRARQGMVICVPAGNGAKNIDDSYLDPTRIPLFYDSTYDYLKSLGIKELE